MPDDTRANARMLLDAAAAASPVIVLLEHVQDDLEALTSEGTAPVLAIVRRLVEARRAMPPPLPARFVVTSLRYWNDGSLRPGRHGEGQAVDLGGMDFTAADPQDVFQIIQEVIGYGAKRIGLPFQGQFFPLGAKCADGAALPAQGCLRFDQAAIFKPSAELTNQAKTRIVNGWLRGFLASQADLIVFPDRDNHVHVSAT